MHRFFLAAQYIQSEEVSFPEDISHQLRRVLRLKDSERVLVLDNEGLIYEVALQIPGEGKILGKILKKSIAEGEPALQLDLYIGLTQREKFEWILQKGTEIGIRRFIPFISERSIIQKNDIGEKKGRRWLKILTEAAEQSCRGKIPGLAAPLLFSEAVLEAIQAHDAVIMPWEDEQAKGLRNALQQIPMPSRMALIIGPEGGFSVSEVQAASANGVISVSLGKRILRMETAAVAAAAMVLYHFREME